MNYADAVNPNKYRSGGTIVGPYNFAADVNMGGGTVLKLAHDSAKLVDSADPDNNVKFTVGYVEVSKGLNVVGPLVAPNLANQAVYPVDIVCDSIVNGGHIQTVGLSASLEVDADTIIATSQVTAAKVVCAGDVEADAVKTTKWVGQLSGQPDYDAMEYKTNEVVFGGGTLNGTAMPQMKMNHNEIHISHGGTNGVFVGPVDTRVKQGTTETIYGDDEKITNLDNYSEAMMSVLTPADPSAGLGALITVASYVMPFFTPSAHPELRRRMASDYHFIDDTGAMESYSVRPQSAQVVHLSNAELDVTDANSLVNKTGHALKTALRDTRNPRTIIAGTQAEFGLHQDYDDTNDAVPVHLLLTQPSAVDASYLQTQVDKQILKCTNKSGVAFEVSYKGYDANDALTNEGTRIAVSGQDEVGKVYLGKFANGLPADSTAEAAFSHVNVQGSVRFSKAPTGSNVSGDIVAEVTPTGLKVDDIRPQGSQLDFYNAIDFSNATVTGLSQTGLANAADMIGGIEVTGICQATEAFMFDGSATARWDETGFLPIGDVDFTAANEVDFTGTTIVGFSAGGLANAADTSSPLGVAITGQLTIGTPSAGNLQVSITGDNVFTNTTGRAKAHWQFLENSTDAYCNLRLDGMPRLYTHVDIGTGATDMTSNLRTVTFNGNHNITGPTPTGLPGTYTPSDYIPLKVKWSDYSNVTPEDNPIIADFSTTGLGVIFTVSGEEVESTVKIVAPNIDSSGNFTACHACEPVNQSTEIAVGKLVKSSGVYCSRGNDGTKYVLPKNAPTTSHAMCSVELCETDQDPAFLGIVSTVELVASATIEHQHGGLHIKSKYTGESDGYKVLRVAASGDAMALVCGNGTSSQNVAVGDLITGSDTRKGIVSGGSGVTEADILALNVKLFVDMNQISGVEGQALSTISPLEPSGLSYSLLGTGSIEPVWSATAVNGTPGLVAPSATGRYYRAVTSLLDHSSGQMTYVGLIHKGSTNGIGTFYADQCCQLHLWYQKFRSVVSGVTWEVNYTFAYNTTFVVVYRNDGTSEILDVYDDAGSLLHSETNASPTALPTIATGTTGSNYLSTTNWSSISLGMFGVLRDTVDYSTLLDYIKDVGTISTTWSGGYLQKQSGAAIYNYSVAKSLMAVDFSQSTATLQQTFSGVDEFVAEDTLTYRTVLVPVVFT